MVKELIRSDSATVQCIIHVVGVTLPLYEYIVIVLSSLSHQTFVEQDSRGSSHYHRTEWRVSVMRFRRSGLTVVSLLLVGLGSSISTASDARRFTVGSLHGLRGAFVTVHYSGKPHPEAGLTDNQLASEVSLRLQVAGLNVLTESEWKKTPGKPYLYLNLIDTGIPGRGKKDIGHVYTCSLDLMQETSLTRSPGLVVDACTWSRGATIVVPSNDLSQVRILIGDLASEFTTAVTAANQPKRETTATSKPLEK
jgi:hypothetical protein